MDEPLPTVDSPKQAAAWRSSALVVMFVVSLLTPTGATLCGLGKPFDQAAEQRMQEPFPSVQWPIHMADIQSLPRRLERCLTDRTRLRQEATSAVRMAAWHGCLVGDLKWIKPANLARFPERHFAVHGQGRWLFFLSERQVRELQGTAPWSEAEIARIHRQFDERRAWLAERGIPYVVVIAPDKHSVYPEHLPGWARPKGSPTPADQFIECARRLGRVHVLDLRTTLCSAKQANQVFFELDTHWNSRGAFEGSRAVINELRSYCPDLQPIPLTEYGVGVGHYSNCDLARMLNLPRTEQFERLYWKNAQYEPLGKVLNARAGEVHVAKTSSAPPRTLFVMGDSFFLGMWEHVRPYFRESFVASPVAFPASEIERRRPTIVVHQFVERSMPRVVFENSPEVAEALQRDLSFAARQKASPR